MDPSRKNSRNYEKTSEGWNQPKATTNQTNPPAVKRTTTKRILETPKEMPDPQMKNVQWKNHHGKKRDKSITPQISAKKITAKKMETENKKAKKTTKKKKRKNRGRWNPRGRFKEWKVVRTEEILVEPPDRESKDKEIRTNKTTSK